MTERRFTDKPELAPWAVRGLAPDHPAMRENRTLFPSTVVEVTADEPARLLVSGENNRKLGKTVIKGAFKGYALYGLSLEERATCPDDCAVRDVCYGNGMQMARRHRIGDEEVFFDRLGFELCELLDEHTNVLIRLHVLGDFPSTEYVAFWADALEEYPTLACYGYTARRTTAWGGDEIGDAIEAVKERFPARFRIRWSGPTSRPDGAVVVGNVPKTARIAEGLVCPSQTDATACCASCGLCWEPNARNDTIVFIKHGPKSGEVAAAHAMSESRQSLTALLTGDPSPSRQELGALTEDALAARNAAIIEAAKREDVERVGVHAALGPAMRGVARPQPINAPDNAPEMPRPTPDSRAGEVEEHPDLRANPAGLRRVRPIELGKLTALDHIAPTPEARLVFPEKLLVEPSYQRDLSSRSISLIRKIVNGWDWAKFKPPICAEGPDGLFVIDGQHTAIAAVTRGIRQIPVLIVSAKEVESRAAAFVSHNSDRVVMSPLQVFHANATAGDDISRRLLALAKSTGARFPRSTNKRSLQPGDVVAVRQLRGMMATNEFAVERVLRIGVASESAPLTRTATVALFAVLTQPLYADVARLADSAIANALRSIGDVERASKLAAAETGQTQERACAVMIADACRQRIAA